MAAEGGNEGRMVRIESMKARGLVTRGSHLLISAIASIKENDYSQSWNRHLTIAYQKPHWRARATTIPLLPYAFPAARLCRQFAHRPLRQRQQAAGGRQSLERKTRYAAWQYG